VLILWLCFGSNVTFRSGPILGQLWVINLAETWSSYGPCVALVWNPDLVHTRAIIHCGMWAKQKLVVWAGAGPEKNCYVGSFFSWHTLHRPFCSVPILFRIASVKNTLYLKGLVHPKMKKVIKSLITHPHAVPTP